MIFDFKDRCYYTGINVKDVILKWNTLYSLVSDNLLLIIDLVKNKMDGYSFNLLHNNQYNKDSSFSGDKYTIKRVTPNTDLLISTMCDENTIKKYINYKFINEIEDLQGILLLEELKK